MFTQKFFIEKSNTLTIGIILCIMLGCSKKNTPFPRAISIDKLKAVPERIEIDDRAYILKAFLWRNAMPMSSSHNGALIALIRVVATDGLPVPASMSLHYLWAVYGRRIWATEFSHENRPVLSTEQNQLEHIARNGPRLNPGTKVDVIVSISNKSKEYLLRASNQLIRTAH